MMLHPELLDVGSPAMLYARMPFSLYLWRGLVGGYPVRHETSNEYYHCIRRLSGLIAFRQRLLNALEGDSVVYWLIAHHNHPRIH